MTLEELRAGGKRALAGALARLETAAEAPETVALLDAALEAPKGIALGLTGPPGVGKSTLTDALIRHWRRDGRTVGVIAVDPSSKVSGGALLGDRTRLTTDPEDQGVFVRSMAARTQLGGLAETVFPAMVLMRALYDIVLIETVGVGQSETAVAETTDLVALCAQPGSGDALQYMKAGIMEIPDLVIVTKADMGAIARQTLADLRGGLSLTVTGRTPEVLSCSAGSGDGVDYVVAAVDKRVAQFKPQLRLMRTAQANHWLEAHLEARFGRFGVDTLRATGSLQVDDKPFRAANCLGSRLRAAWAEAFPPR